jgi:TonB family protein
MEFLKTEEEKKSFAITTALFVLLFILCLFLGLTYLDPPPENGIAVNFGTSETGMGDKQPTEAIQSAPQPTASQESAAAKEEILSQDIEEAVVIKETKKPQKTTKEDTKEDTKEVIKPTPAVKPQPSKSTSDALSSLINGPKSDGKAQGGEGDHKTAGDKGSPDGDPYASSYFGSGTGKSGGRGWGLNGRKLSNSGKEVQNCNESGTVVVQITVNRSGNVIDARYAQGTTNTNPCLVNPAIATAKKYKWQSDPNAPETQVGFIVVNFKLGE